MAKRETAPKRSKTRYLPGEYLITALGVAAVTLILWLVLSLL